MPRDIFDIAAAGERNADAIVEQLRSYKDEVAKMLASMEKLNPDFVRDTIADLAIKERYRALAGMALDKSKEMLRTV